MFEFRKVFSRAAKDFVQQSLSQVMSLNTLDRDVARAALLAFERPTDAARWLISPNVQLRGAIPVELCKNPGNVPRVLSLLEHRISSKGYGSRVFPTEIGVVRNSELLEVERDWVCMEVDNRVIKALSDKRTDFPWAPAASTVAEMYVAGLLRRQIVASETPRAGDPVGDD